MNVILCMIFEPKVWKSSVVYTWLGLYIFLFPLVNYYLKKNTNANKYFCFVNRFASFKTLLYTKNLNYIG